tara:strand:- start:13036 stop:15438 length:2403 start_codon:yes stop_codon:yes gene_type:complete
MRVPLSWLEDYVPLNNTDPVELAHRLTMAGLETTYVQGLRKFWNNVIVGQIELIEAHPNADRLKLATINIGEDRCVVVCGAPNIEVGQKIAFAQLGAKLFNSKTNELIELTTATIRGVESAGMICSELELGLSSNHEGILVLPSESRLGSPLSDALHSSDAFEIEITANRGDCLSVLGIAHEVAAIIGEKVLEPALEYQVSQVPIEELITVAIENSELCTRYACTLTQGVSIEESPQWLQERLRDSGHRPINNIVDITNFVMLEYGQPLHAFDYDQISDSQIIVRSAFPGEKFTSLDHATHELQPPMLMIADSKRSIGLAGVMGGLNSEMTSSTKNVLLEAATFNGINTRRTANKLKLRTEASLRFEKGLNPELAIRALKRATMLVGSIAGGNTSKGIYDIFPDKKDSPEIIFPLSVLEKILGISYPVHQVEQVLNSLGFGYSKMNETTLRITPPYWRTDVEIEEDIVEEIARTIGYDTIPNIPLVGLVPQPVHQPIRILREKIKDSLVGLGFNETISHTLVSIENLQSTQSSLSSAVRTENPMSREQEFLRISIIPEILKATSEALKHYSGPIKFFEAGRVFIKQNDDLPQEDEMVVGVLAGSPNYSFWDKATQGYDFFDGKGITEAIFEELGVKVTYKPLVRELLKKGYSSEILAGENSLGFVGELSSVPAGKFDLPTSGIIIFELNLTQLVSHLPMQKASFTAFSRYPAATRDLALVVKFDIPAQQLISIIKEEPLVTEVSLFDVFQGGALKQDEKSLAFRIELQSNEGTLTAKEMDSVFSSILDKLANKTGAVART